MAKIARAEREMLLSYILIFRDKIIKKYLDKKREEVSFFTFNYRLILVVIED